MTKTHAAAVAVAVLCVISSATAHVVLESKQAPAGSTYKAVLQVGHGCEGSPTKSIRVQIPEGVIAVKPMPKPGWELTTKRGEYAQAYDYYGEKLTEGVKESPGPAATCRMNGTTSSCSASGCPMARRAQ